MPDSAPAVLSAEERQKRIAEQTSIGRYTVKQLQQTFIPLAGAAIGWFAGAGLMKNSAIASFVQRKIPSLDIINPGHVFSGITAFVGTFIAGMFNAYEHWKNVESEKLAVNEINQDVGNLVTERAKFAETLNRQEAMIKDLVAKGQSKESFTERSETPEPSADRSR